MVTNDSKINNARVMTMFMAIRNFELKNVRTLQYDSKDIHCVSNFEWHSDFLKRDKRAAPARMNRCGPLIDGNLIQSEIAGVFTFSFFFQFTNGD